MKIFIVLLLSICPLFTAATNAQTAEESAAWLQGRLRNYCYFSHQVSPTTVSIPTANVEVGALTT
jgi:hypothetical protein